ADIGLGYGISAVYWPLADVGLICDNAGERRVLIAEKLHGSLRDSGPDAVENDRGGDSMTDLTPEQIKAAVLKGLKEVAAQFAKDPTPTDGTIRIATRRRLNSKRPNKIAKARKRR